MTGKSSYRIKTITEYHRLAGLPQPAHPLVSFIDLSAITPPVIGEPFSLVLDFYSISLKRVTQAKFKYGQQSCDFDDGVLFFMAPGQLFTTEIDKNATHKPHGWMLYVHPDFLWGTQLAHTIRQNELFSYSVYEALYLSDREEAMITGIAHQIAQEIQTYTDRHTQQVVTAQLELLLSYADRFYDRQFITRKVINHEILTRLDNLLSGYFQSGALATQGLPAVTWIADSLHVSPGYLSSLLKNLTGQSTQQHLHNKLIDLAKDKLATTRLSVSEIAYELGFGHLQSFSKLFKAQTNLSPLAFRQSLQ